MKLKLPEELEYMQIARLPQKSFSGTMDEKLVIITGATSGVGYEAAKRFAMGNAKLVFVVRNEEKAIALCEEIKALSKAEPDYFIADFADLEKIRSVSEVIRDKYGKIDVLINNAGVFKTTRELTNDGHELVFCVNHLASFLMTVILMEKMAKKGPSRIIHVNSEGHRFNGLKLDDLNWEKRKYRGLKGYGASKTAQLLSLIELARILEGTGVTINAMHPGAVKSNIGNNNGWLYRSWSRYVIQPMLKKTEISGEALYYLAGSPDLDGVNGMFFNLTNKETPAKHARNTEIARKIFQLTKEITKLENRAYYEF